MAAPAALSGRSSDVRRQVAPEADEPTAEADEPTAVDALPAAANAASADEELDSDEEFEAVLFRSMEQIELDEAVARSLEHDELTSEERDLEPDDSYRPRPHGKQPRREHEQRSGGGGGSRGPAGGGAPCSRHAGEAAPCRLLQLPDELVRRIFRFVSVAGLLGTVRFASKRTAALVESAVRELTRSSLHDALLAGFESEAMPLPEARRRELHALSEGLESALVTATAKQESSKSCARALTSKCRSICFNLSDVKNPELRHRLLRGELQCAVLVKMSPQEMASLTLQKQRSEWHRKSLACAIKPERVHGFATDLYRCDVCGSREARVHRVIRPGRQIDRARTYATCTSCKARWEV